jgi:hypothetical protein
MALDGRAFLAMWHDIAEAGEAEYGEWHTRQHMPERLGVPGFLDGRRYVDWDRAEERWFTLYATRTLEVLSSDGYRARLNAPTQWSGRVQPHFRNFTRSACVLSASVGRGLGGALRTVRLELQPEGIAGFEAGAEAMAARLLALPGVTAAHLGVAAPDTTRIRTRESEMRAATAEKVFGAVAMVEGVGRRALLAAAPAIDAVLAEAGGARTAAVYDLAYQLRADPAS